MDFRICIGTHVKSVAQAAVHIAYAAVPVFINAVNPDGNGILYIEQKVKYFMIVETLRFLSDKMIQSDVQLIKESHVTIHVHGGVMELLPTGYELVYREHISRS